MEDLALIDELAFNAWPAPVTQRVEEWTLRFGWGATRRANSAWPGTRGPADAGPLIEATERAYRGWMAPPRVQITHGLVDDLDEILDARGWSSEGACHVMCADLADVLARTPERETQIAALPDDDWIRSWWSAGRGGDPPPAAARIVCLPLPSAAHSRLHVDGSWAAVGRGVCERGWLGLFSIATRPERRGNGHATALIGGLARWGRARGADRAYLQVEVDNTPAIRLFGRLGFSAIGGYHYRTLRP